MMPGGMAADRSELAARLALLAVPRLPARRVIGLVEVHGSARHGIGALEREFGADIAAAARSRRVVERVRRALHAIAAQRIRVIAFDDAAYPPRLRARLDNDAPPLLFAVGDLALLSRPGIGAVGARSASQYGLDVAAQIGDAVGRTGACLISGLALGIDAAAHEAALEAGGGTIAVLGCGVDVYYPRRNIELQRRIATTGLLLSELLPGEPPRKRQFPHRNRIIAALSKAVVVVEAGARSGAITTASHAMGQDIPVYGVPNAIDRDTMQGILALYRDGVAPFTGVRDLLESSGILAIGAPIPERAAIAETAPAGPLPGNVWSAIGTRPVHVDAIARAAGVSPAQTLAVLLDLELDGRIVQLPGGRYQRRPRLQGATAGAAAG
jgi:DNA processing protein